MFDRAHLVTALDCYADMKRSACAEANGPADLIPILEVIDTAGNRIIASPDSADIIPSAIAIAREALDAPVAGVIWLSESYVRAVPPGAPPSRATPPPSTTATPPSRSG